MTTATETPIETKRAPLLSVARVYEGGQSFSYKCRANRFAHIKALIDTIIEKNGQCRILDVGGTEYYWRIAGDLFEKAPVTVDLINLEKADVSAPWCRSFAGDACNLDGIDTGAYDLVHSNSVIEHVGQWQQMASMAGHIRRIAPNYYVQTPYFWFPYEPHFRFAGFHWLPETVRYKLLMRFNLGFGGKRETVDAAMRGIQSSNMLDQTQFESLFPDAQIRHERFFGLTKSLMAIRSETDTAPTQTD